MIDTGVTWVLVADGAHARLFEERQRTGALHEKADWTMRLQREDRPRAPAHAATVHERGGTGRHGDKDHAPAQEAERRFLARVAEALNAAGVRGEFDHLVIMAPPAALGVLRARLAPRLSGRLEATDPHNRLGDDADAMRAHLRQLRARI
jgi:protein required for attachment to host cells